jgi:hypothetical protein
MASIDAGMGFSLVGRLFLAISARLFHDSSNLNDLYEIPQRPAGRYGHWKIGVQACLLVVLCLYADRSKLQRGSGKWCRDLKLAVGQRPRRLRSEANPSELNLSQMGALARLEQGGATTTAELARGFHEAPVDGDRPRQP